MIALVNADSRKIPLADQSVQCVVTSPPYYGLRDYGVDSQIGIEATPQAYVASIVVVMREVWRVLRPSGTLWLNLGDSYASAGGDHSKYNKNQPNTGAARCHANGSGDSGLRKPPCGLKPKDLCGIPWHVAFALQDDGWYLRSDIIWHKPNPMPESVTDRPTKAHEYIFLLTKQERYYYDADAIKEPSKVGYRSIDFMPTSQKDKAATAATAASMNNRSNDFVSTRNKRTVWTVATSSYNGAHFATFPPALVEPMILAGSQPGDIVLDPFCGSGTVGQVCRRFGRSFVGLDLSETYLTENAMPWAQNTNTARSMAALPMFSDAIGNWIDQAPMPNGLNGPVGDEVGQE